MPAAPRSVFRPVVGAERSLPDVDPELWRLTLECGHWVVAWTGPNLGQPRRCPMCSGDTRTWLWG